jgi:signal transduction histidine kinase
MEPDEERKRLQHIAEELQASQKHLVSIASHDLKGPLNRLYALVQLLQMSAQTLTPEQQNYLEKMHIVIADGMAMIRNLIDYRNLEFGTVTLTPEALPLGDIIRQSVKSFDAVARKKNITLRMDELTEVSWVTDRQCLQRAFDNLLSNAVKFSFSNKNVVVRSGLTSDAAWIDVQDEARGFTPAEQEQLFQKFKKFSARPTGGESTTGLGLFIAEQMMLRINGKVSCRTVEGIGSTFRMEFRSLKN